MKTKVCFQKLETVTY